MSTRKALNGGRPGLAPTGSVASSLAALLSLVFLPKCPLCIAAYLAGLGLGSAAAAFAAPLVRPLAVVLAIMAGAALLRSGWRYFRRARANARRPTNCCC
jgi:hypothetical protein